MRALLDHPQLALPPNDPTAQLLSSYNCAVLYEHVELARILQPYLDQESQVPWYFNIAFICELSHVMLSFIFLCTFFLFAIGHLLRSLPQYDFDAMLVLDVVKSGNLEMLKLLLSRPGFEVPSRDQVNLLVFVPLCICRFHIPFALNF